jgi:hypothetical protein
MPSEEDTVKFFAFVAALGGTYGLVQAFGASDGMANSLAFAVALMGSAAFYFAPEMNWVYAIRYRRAKRTMDGAAGGSSPGEAVSGEMLGRRPEPMIDSFKQVWSVTWDQTAERWHSEMKKQLEADDSQSAVRPTLSNLLLRLGFHESPDSQLQLLTHFGVAGYAWRRAEEASPLGRGGAKAFETNAEAARSFASMTARTAFADTFASTHLIDHVDDLGLNSPGALDNGRRFLSDGETLAINTVRALDEEASPHVSDEDARLCFRAGVALRDVEAWISAVLEPSVSVGLDEDDDPQDKPARSAPVEEAGYIQEHVAEYRQALETTLPGELIPDRSGIGEGETIVQAEGILRERLARGEISVEEFRALRQVLRE